MSSSNRFGKELKELEKNRPKIYGWSRSREASVNECQEDCRQSKEKSLKEIWSRAPDNHRSSLVDTLENKTSETRFFYPLLGIDTFTSDKFQEIAPSKPYDQSFSPTNFLGSNKKSWSTPLASPDSFSSQSSIFKQPPVQEQPSSSRSHDHSVRYLSDSLSFMTLNAGIVNDSVSIMRGYHVVKAINIPWCVSIKDITQVLSQSGLVFLPSTKELSQCVHITMDTKTGKTLGVAFIECKYAHDQDRCPDFGKILPVQGRRLRFTESSYDELLRHLFPGWSGYFRQGLAYKNIDQKSFFFLNQKDLQSLLNICRNYKVYYNRKCAERPYEYLISIVINIPWNQPRTVTTVQRDLIYECCKLATETLKNHTERGMSPFETDLLFKLVRTAIICPGFSIKQKNGVLSNAKMECPRDLKTYIEETNTFVDSTILEIIR